MGKRIPLALPFLPFSLCADAAQLTKHVRHLLFTAICLLTISSTANVARGFEYTYEGQTLHYIVIDEKAKTCVCFGDSTTGHLTIPMTASDNINEYTVTSIGVNAFAGCSGLTSVTIPNTVTSIKNCAFLKCSSLTSVTIPESVTSIGEYAFKYCQSLSSVIIPNSVTSIGRETFAFCSGLTSVTIPESVTSIGKYAFQDCQSLTSVIIPETVTTIDVGAFEFCSSLTSVNIPNSVSSIGEYAFFECNDLKTVTIPASVTSIGECAFVYCDELTEITVDSGNKEYMSVEGVLFSKDLSQLIQYPGGKKGSYVIPNSVISIGESAFAGCSGLTSVIIPESVISIDKTAFYRCHGLTTLTIPASVTSIDLEAFGNCAKLTDITVDSENKEYASIEGVLFSKDISRLIQYPGGKTGSYIIPNSVTSIRRCAFVFCNGLQSVTIPDSVIEFETQYLPEGIPSSVFYVCNALTEVNYAADVPIEGDYSYFDLDIYSRATLYVKEKALARAKQIDPWKNFKNIQTKKFSGVDSVAADYDESLPVSVFSLNGVYVGNNVDSLAPGIYIVRQGSSVRKITVK